MKPMICGLDYLRGTDWNPRKFNLKGAQRQMARFARKSTLSRVSGCTGIVTDCGEYFRGTIAALPIARGK